MKKAVVLLGMVLLSISMMAQDISGQWNGFLKVPGGQLPLIFKLSKTESGYSSTMDSPDQGAKGIVLTSCSFEKAILRLSLSSANLVYEGELNPNGVIVGTFTQSGQSFPLNLSRQQLKKEVANRPQEPKAPFSYYVEEVSFENKTDKNILSGTLTLPQKEGRFPVVILISGSGAQNRDQLLFQHKPFLVLADHLTKKGIAVLRFDDRGTGKSTGDFKKAVTQDFAKDVQAAMAYLQSRKEIDKNRIGLIGHSEGAMVAPLVAQDSKEVRALLLLAGVGIATKELLLQQKEGIERQMKVPESEIKFGKEVFSGAYDQIVSSTGTADVVKDQLNAYLTDKLEHKLNQDQINALAASISSPWMINFLKLNPSLALEKVKCPVLALNGEKDIQVAADLNLEAIKSSLLKGGNKNTSIKKLPGLNHLFQECESGSPAEYEGIEQTFSPVALDEISKWLLQQFK